MQAGLVCLFIEQRWGFERLAALLRQFTRNASTAQAVEAVFRTSPKNFDKEFDAFVRTRFALAPRQSRRLGAAVSARPQGDRRTSNGRKWSNRRSARRRCIRNTRASASPNLLLAHALEKLGRKQDALAALEAYRKAGGWDPGALRDLVRLLDEAGRERETRRMCSAR